MSSTTPAGWYPDPYNAAQLRYWDGAVWTESVSPAGGPAGADATRQLVTDQTETFPTADPGASPYTAGQGTGPVVDPGAGGQYSPPGQTAGMPGAGGATDQWAVPTGPPSLDGTGNVAWAGSTSGHYQPGTGLGDVGDWLSSIFTKLIERIGAIALLLFVLPAIVSLASALVSQRLLSGLVLDLEPDSDLEFEIAGFNGGLFALLTALGIVALLVWIVARLGVNHQLYAAHSGVPQPLGSSLRTAFRRLPRTILWGLVLVVAAMVVATIFAVMLAVVVAVSVGDGDGGGSPLFALLVVPIVVFALVGAAWLWTKLAFFLPALAVAPAGTNPFAASWSMSRARFWPVFGRLLLVSVALWVLWGIFNAIFQPIFGSAAADLFQLDVVTGDVFVDGENVNTLDEIRWEDVVPGVGWFASVAVLYTLGRSVIDAIWTSAITGLYWRGGGKGEI
ncbi:MAG: DUF2510 domain-containing protein [Acidimicrobiales bacterium]